MKGSSFAIACALIVLGGCDQLGIESATQTAAKREAEGRAIGGACRHAGRAIEDCYTLNKKAEKASVYAGWREMDDYMRENKLEPVPAQLTPAALAASRPAGGDEAADAAAEAPEKPAKPSAKSAGGGSSKHS